MARATTVLAFVILFVLVAGFADGEMIDDGGFRRENRDLWDDYKKFFDSCSSNTDCFRGVCSSTTDFGAAINVCTPH